MEKQERFMLDLETKYPKLFKKRVWPEFDEGWHDVINKLCEEMYKKYEEWGNTSDLPYVAQMKEKFGGLRFYLESDTFFMDEPEKYEELDKIIRKYELISAKTCETCGKEGTLGKRKNSDYWLKTLCEECRK